MGLRQDRGKGDANQGMERDSEEAVQDGAVIEETREELEETLEF